MSVHVFTQTCALTLQDLFSLFYSSLLSFQRGLFSESLIPAQLWQWLMYMFVIIHSHIMRRQERKQGKGCALSPTCSVLIGLPSIRIYLSGPAHLGCIHWVKPGAIHTQCHTKQIILGVKQWINQIQVLRLTIDGWVVCWWMRLNWRISSQKHLRKRNDCHNCYFKYELRVS